ncbi:hypothetical protein YC2023_048083 [Brassica napus]
MQTLLVYQQPQRLKELKESTIQATTVTGNLNAPVDETMFDIEKEVDDLLPVEVKEQRVSNFLRVLEDYHATFVEAVPFRMIAMSLSQVFSPRVGELRSGQMSPRVVLRVVQTRLIVGGVP